MATSLPLDGAPLWHRARLLRRRVLRYRFWVKGHVAALRHQTDPSATVPLADDETHLRAAAAWLARAQDEAGNGGVTGRYLMRSGWTTAYPETTGYIVPTFLELAKRYGEDWTDRAARAVDFLLGTQLEDGAFPGGEIGQNTTKPSPFNTGQILNGLLAWSQANNDQAALDAAVRGADWLVSIQDDDGAWRRFVYHDEAACYHAHLACWLADVGAATGERRFVDHVDKHLDWVMAQRADDSAWFDRTGFTAGEQALRIADLHTTAYTLAGMLGCAAVCEREDVTQAAAAAAREVGATLDRLGWLPGVVDHQWQARADSSCLTGNVQMALVWYRLADMDGHADWLRWADKAIDLAKAGQLVDCACDGLRGGLPGCTPMWGWYNDGSVMSWSAKFLIDALIERGRRD